MDKLKIALIHGTVRPGNRSEKVAQYIYEIGKKFEEIELAFVHATDFDLPFDGINPDTKDPKFTDLVANSDGFFIVTPEYNHSIPGSLKRLLDSEFENYNRKAVAIAGVSDGPWGGVRAIEALIHVTKALGLANIKKDVQFPLVLELFDESGKFLQDEKYRPRVEGVYMDLIWMARALKNARENKI